MATSVWSAFTLMSYVKKRTNDMFPHFECWMKRWVTNESTEMKWYVIGWISSIKPVSECGFVNNEESINGSITRKKYDDILK